MQALLGLAKHPRVYVKLSAFYALGEGAAPYADLVPAIKRVIGSFGVERCMWATDCPYQVHPFPGGVPGTIEGSLKVVRDQLEVGPAELEWLLRKTAEAVYFFDAAGTTAPAADAEPAAGKPAPVQLSWSAQCTGEERRFVYQIMVINVLRGWVATVCLIAYNRKYLAICGGDTGTMALHMGLIRSCKNVINVFMSPIVGGLSDQYGRIPAMAFGRVGWVLIWLWLPRVTTLRSWFAAEIICTGILRGGDNASQSAAISDYFGMRPTLSSTIQAKLGMISQIGEFFGPVISDIWSYFFGRESTFYVSAALSMATLGVLTKMKEPLKPADRSVTKFSMFTFEFESANLP